MSYIYGRDDQFFLAKATDYKTIRNSTGTASLGNGDACKHRNFTGNPQRNRSQTPDKESTSTLGFKDTSVQLRSNPVTATIVTPLFTASGAGVEPDNGPLFESAFGKKTISADTSVTYGPNGSKYLNESSPVAVEAWGMNGLVSKRGMVGVGIVNRFVIVAAQDFAEVTADVLCYNVLTQDRFAAASTAEKMGISAWPSVPSSPSYTGSIMNGFTGSLTLDGVQYTGVRSVTLTCNMNRNFRSDLFAADGSEYLPSEPFELQPEFLLDFSLQSLANSSDIDALLAKIAARTAFDGTLVIGNTAGGTYTIALNNLIIPDGREAQHEDGDDRKAVTVRGLRAQITSAGTRDELGSGITLT